MQYDNATYTDLAWDKITWNEWTESERAAYICALTRYPDLTHREIGEIVGLSHHTLRKLVAQGRREGHQSDSDLYEKGNRHPSRDEMRWRFANQSFEGAYKKFAGGILDEVRRLGLEEELPDAWSARLFGEAHKVSKGAFQQEIKRKAKDCVRRIPSTFEVAILDTDVRIEFDSIDQEAEIAEIAAFVDSLDNRYKIDGSDWKRVKPAIDQMLLIYRYRRNLTDGQKQDLDTLDELGKLEIQLNDWIKRLAFEPKTGTTEYQLLMQCINDAPNYLAERGWRQAFACANCGTIHAVYLPIYRKCVGFIDLCRTVVDRQWASASELVALRDAALEILTHVEEHPLLRRELKDLGVAWSLPLVQWFYWLQSRHPEITVDELRLGLAAFFELGESCFDESLPYSPINRIAKVDGKLVVTTPED